MRRILLTVAYDGTDFHGYAFQEGVRCVEGTLQEALLRLTDAPCAVIGASRTDAGVHAYGNLATFDTDASIPPERFAPALNTILPPDVRIVQSEEVPDTFHPRRCGWPKTYEYRILNAEAPDPVMRRYTCHYRTALDTDAMNDAARALCGTHDFTSFCSVHALSPTRTRTVRSVRVFRRDPCALPFPEEEEEAGEAKEAHGALVVIRVTGEGFLYHMVRIIAGTLLDVGRGHLKPDAIPAILEARDRARAGATLPPEGLFLMGYHRTEEKERVKEH